MAGRTASDLAPEEIVDTAIDIFSRHGLAAVSMRSVGARLGVSPVPLYRRVGNKDALLDAMADRLLADMAPEPLPDEPWATYATRWAEAVRARLAATGDMRLLLGDRRSPFVAASRPLLDTLRAGGFAPDAAVQACRLLLWAVVGFGVIEARRPVPPPAPRPSSAGGRRPGTRRPGGDPTGVSAADADQLFLLHVRYLLDGLARDRCAP
jgi:TetR/AcrR family transcriptional regulator, tetracycline repressor protein